VKPAIDFNLGLFKNTISQNFWNKVFLVNDHHQPVADHVTRESYVCFVTMLGIVWTETPLLNRDPSFPRPAWRPRPGGRQSASDPGHVSVPSERWSGFISRREIQICSLRIFYVDDVLFFFIQSSAFIVVASPCVRLKYRFLPWGPWTPKAGVGNLRPAWPFNMARIRIRVARGTTQHRVKKKLRGEQTCRQKVKSLSHLDVTFSFYFPFVDKGRILR